ncbi:FxLD family lanthipeptide [Streptomyces hokutonensis]|uniref:FxLD family lanthipeptide n=1 Tax=Streptomyces hokutonensis TaxID=1306990 RepID=UPI0036C50CCF
MTSTTVAPPTPPADLDDDFAPLDVKVVADDPFQLDITIIEGTPETETILMCGTGDNCGTSCPSACSGSTV